MSPLVRTRRSLAGPLLKVMRRAGHPMRPHELLQALALDGVKAGASQLRPALVGLMLRGHVRQLDTEGVDHPAYEVTDGS